MAVREVPRDFFQPNLPSKSRTVGGSLPLHRSGHGSGSLAPKISSPSQLCCVFRRCDGVGSGPLSPERGLWSCGHVSAGSFFLYDPKRRITTERDCPFFLLGRAPAFALRASAGRQGTEHGGKCPVPCALYPHLTAICAAAMLKRNGTLFIF